MTEESKPSPLPYVWFALSKANEKLYDMKRREKILMGANGKKNSTSTNASTLMPAADFYPKNHKPPEVSIAIVCLAPPDAIINLTSF